MSMKSIARGRVALVSVLVIMALLFPAAAQAETSSLPKTTVMDAGHRSTVLVSKEGRQAAARRGKWIEVDLSKQRVYVHEGSRIVRSMVVSTGIARYPTPTGRFRIYAKYRAVTMSGPGYHLPRVPHTMFFYRGYALHGTYWHHNFGRRMSHGCINLKRADAAWLYKWAPRRTLVVIHR